MKLETVTVVIALAILIVVQEQDMYAESLQSSSEKPPSQLRGTSKLSGSKHYSPPGKVVDAGRMTCNQYPRVCHVRGSPGPDCCKKKCVNVKTDGLNCGMCGYKCGHHETCCNGRCVDPLRDRKHCGGCGNKCRNGDVCHYGMCNYA